jgi:hypothetical protein
MKEEISWTVTEPSGKVTTSKPVEKHYYVAKIQIPKDVDGPTKQFWVNYNSMQKFISDNGQMESK